MSEGGGPMPAIRQEDTTTRMTVQPAMLYGIETVPLTRSHVNKLEVTAMKMCRFACGYTNKPCD